MDRSLATGRYGMYWPDYEVRPHSRSSLLGPTLLSALLIGLILAGVINGWWRSPAAADDGKVVTSRTKDEPGQVEVARPPTSGQIPTKAPSLDRAPPFSLPDLFDEQMVHRLADYRGRPLILNFWASWCAPCRAEMPALQRAYIDHWEENLVVLGVNQTFIDDTTLARDFVRELALTFPNARDDDGKMSTGLYQVLGLPTSVFITTDGEIAFVKVGQMTEEKIDILTRKLIANEPLSP